MGLQCLAIALIVVISIDRDWCPQYVRDSVGRKGQKVDDSKNRLEEDHFEAFKRSPIRVMSLVPTDRPKLSVGAPMWNIATVVLSLFNVRYWALLTCCAIDTFCHGERTGFGCCEITDFGGMAATKLRAVRLTDFGSGRCAGRVWAGWLDADTAKTIACEAKRLFGGGSGRFRWLGCRWGYSNCQVGRMWSASQVSSRAWVTTV